MNPFIWILLLALSAPSFASDRVRKVEINQDQIATVRTALGIATIIQVPDRPNSIVVGDQGAFKVEYLDQAITIKPLRAGARSNLYVYTDFRRFNVQLVTGAEPSADYVVYLENPKEKKQGQTLRWMMIQRKMKNDELSFIVNRVARTHDGILILEFSLASNKRVKIAPEWFWLIQGGVTRPIQNLFLSKLECSSGKSITGSFQLLLSDLDANAPLRLEMRRKRTSFLTIPKVVAWK